MKGCIIKNDEISIKDICNIIGDVDNYNWLITNIECYPSDEEIVKILDNEYCWIEGRSLLDLLAKEEFQWIWGVFSAFPKEIRLEEVLKSVSYTHLRAHETSLHLVCRLLLEKKKYT